MSFLLDTCALSELTRPRPNTGLATWFERQDASRLFVSALTIGEIERGVALLEPGRKRAGLAAWLATLQAEYGERVLVVDAAAAAAWGRMAARTRAEGHEVKVVDGLIAATAIHHGLTVITRNTEDFAATGASIENPWSDDV